MLAFGGGHIESALNIAGLPELSIWAGWLLDPKTPILLVLENDLEVDKVVPLFLRTGYTEFEGYLEVEPSHVQGLIAMVTLLLDDVSRLVKPADSAR